MKILILFLILFASTGLANAQMEYGTVYFNGSTSLSYSSDNNSGRRATNIYLQSGYFISDNLVVGVGYGISNVKYQVKLAPGDPILNQFNLNPKHRVFQLFGRYYYKNAYIGPGYESLKTDSDSYNYFNIQLGYAALLNNFVALEPRLAYNIGLVDEENYLSFQVGFGFYIYKKGN